PVPGMFLLFSALQGKRPPVLGAFYLRDYCSDYCFISNQAASPGLIILRTGASTLGEWQIQPRQMRALAGAGGG
ncbi:MAG: hypothetical protein P8M65_03515, partial [Roseibacillus sp.]|nr:hypothetical protein [Roseibacillus sp.]